MEWQPIATAPKGKKIIVFGEVPGYAHEQTCVARYWSKHMLEAPEGFEDEGWAEVDEHGQAYMPADWYEETMGEEAPIVNLKPTHWMPLPEPPEDMPCPFTTPLDDPRIQKMVEQTASIFERKE